MNRRILIGEVIAVALIACGLTACGGVGWTMDGFKVADPTGAISTIDQHWKDSIKSTGNVVNMPDNARCWFEVSSAKVVADEVVCGPVRFAASESTVWQTAAIAAGTNQNKGQTTPTLSGSFQTITGPVPASVSLLRPDGTSAEMSVQLDMPAGKPFPTDSMQDLAVYAADGSGGPVPESSASVQPTPGKATTHSFWLVDTWTVSVSSPGQYAGTSDNWWQAPVGDELIGITANTANGTSSAKGGVTWSIEVDGTPLFSPTDFQSLSGTVAIPQGKTSVFIITVEGQRQTRPLDGGKFTAAFAAPSGIRWDGTPGEITLSNTSIIDPLFNRPVETILENGNFGATISPRDDAGKWAPGGQVWVQYSSQDGKRAYVANVRPGAPITSVAAGDPEAVVDGTPAAGQCSVKETSEKYFLNLSCEFAIPANAQTVEIKTPITVVGWLASSGGQWTISGALDLTIDVAQDRSASN